MPGLTAKVIGADGNMGREHVAAFTDAGVQIVDINPDIISIASPDNTHGDYVLEAVLKNQHVFCEKPLVTSREQMSKIFNAKAPDLCVWQNFPLRYQPLFTSLKDKLPDFGDIYRIEASYNWGRTHKLFESWRNRDPDYSLVMGGMIHMIDLVTWLTDMDVEVVCVQGVNMSAPGYEGLDTISAFCRLENGGICNFIVDGGTGVKDHNHRLTIHGNRGGITVVNREPTNKRAAIYDFVECLEKKDHFCTGMYPTVLALMIDEAQREIWDKSVWV